MHPILQIIITSLFLFFFLFGLLSFIKQSNKDKVIDSKISSDGDAGNNNNLNDELNNEEITGLCTDKEILFEKEYIEMQTESCNCNFDTENECLINDDKCKINRCNCCEQRKNIKDYPGNKSLLDLNKCKNDSNVLIPCINCCNDPGK
jgi:hypothetical protein